MCAAPEGTFQIEGTRGQRERELYSRGDKVTWGHGEEAYRMTNFKKTI
jgi:hypothetical protein